MSLTLWAGSGCLVLIVTVCSFEGGAGGCSAGDVACAPLSPNGPKGPKESSSGSSRVVCAAIRRIGPLDRPAADFAFEGAAVAGTGVVAELD